MSEMTNRFDEIFIEIMRITVETIYYDIFLLIFANLLFPFRKKKIKKKQQQQQINSKIKYIN